MSDADARIRLAAFKFLDRELARDEFASRQLLTQGFEIDGERVPLVGPQGIFKPRRCRFPLTITTAAPRDDRPRPYDDTFGTDGLLRYRYRGTDPNHHENVGLREAKRAAVPLIYLHGIVPGRYCVEYPVFVVGDDPPTLTFAVSVDEHRFASLGNVPDDLPEVEIRRRYATRHTQQRLHQRAFRERVLEAYQRHCAICRLKRDQLLEAAHIVSDLDPLGAPVVPNGVALCALHHAAFDSHLIAIRPDDYRIQVRDDVLKEEDGPMLIHGLQGFHDQPLRLPKFERHRPARDLLERRWEDFKRAV